MGALKAMLIIISYIILVSGMIAADVSARIEGQWALQVGNIIAGEDISIQKPQATLFHQQTADMSDIEHVSINFPAFSNDLVLGPSTFNNGELKSAGGSEADNLATANVLPFGPVNLALPSIQEDVTQSVSTSSTGFFKANWAYIADTASGNLGSEPLGTHLASGHPFKSPKMLGSEFLWPLMTPIGTVSASTGSMMFDLDSLAGDHSTASGIGDMLQNKPIGSILAHAPVYHTPKISFSTRGNDTGTANNTTIQINNTAVMNQTSQNNNTSKPATPTRKPRINPKATKDEIKNMTTLQRIYRDAFIGSTMHKAYEGPTQYPTWIDPYDNGLGCFNQCDFNKILSIARNKTRPGENIAPLFWDL